MKQCARTQCFYKHFVQKNNACCQNEEYKLSLARRWGKISWLTEEAGLTELESASFWLGGQFAHRINLPSTFKFFFALRISTFQQQPPHFINTPTDTTHVYSSCLPRRTKNSRTVRISPLYSLLDPTCLEVQNAPCSLTVSSKIEGDYYSRSHSHGSLNFIETQEAQKVAV